MTFNANSSDIDNDFDLPEAERRRAQPSVGWPNPESKRLHLNLFTTPGISPARACGVQLRSTVGVPALRWDGMCNIIGISIATRAIISIFIANLFGWSAIKIIASCDAIVSNSIG